jgi:hypothetical protein
MRKSLIDLWIFIVTGCIVVWYAGVLKCIKRQDSTESVLIMFGYGW